MCSASNPANEENCSHAKWAALPMPAEPYVNSPASLFARISSIVFKPDSGLVMTSVGELPKRATAEKSSKVSYGSLSFSAGAAAYAEETNIRSEEHTSE